MCELISRKAAIDAVNGLPDCPNGFSGTYDKAAIIGILEDVPSVQPEKQVTTFPVDGEPLDCISRQQAILCIERNAYRHTYVDQIVDIIKWLPSVQPQRWIPFRSRPLTAEEKEEHPEWDAIFESPLPDDGQRILVNIKYKRHEAVQMDEYYDDDGCYLDSGYEIGTEATAWMPLPEPYKE